MKSSTFRHNKLSVERDDDAMYETVRRAYEYNINIQKVGHIRFMAINNGGSGPESVDHETTNHMLVDYGITNSKLMCRNLVHLYLI